MAQLTNEERETHLNLVAANRSQWEVYSDDPVMMAKLDRIATGQPYGAGKRYTLRANQVSFRYGKARAPMSDEERFRRSERMKRMRQEGVL